MVPVYGGGVPAAPPGDRNGAAAAIETGRLTVDPERCRVVLTRSHELAREMVRESLFKASKKVVSMVLAI